MRKRKRVLAALLAFMYLLLTGCGIDAGTGHQESNDIISDAVPDNLAASVNTFGLAYQPEEGLNPYTCTSMTNRTIISLLYESLFTVTSEFAVEPVLCESFSVSDDLLSCTVHIMKDTKFSDGSPLTAGDVVASYRAAAGSAVYGSRYYAISGVEALDDTTVVFHTILPYENLTLLLDLPIVKAGSVGQDCPIGSGPYQLLTERHTNNLIHNDYWWQGTYDCVINAQNIRLVQTDTPTEVRDDFEYGVTGVVCTDPNSSSYVDYHCDYELWNCSTTIMDYIGFNVQTGLFCLTDLRVALTNLIDRDAIATELYHGFAEPAVLPASPLSSVYDKTLAQTYSYRPEEFSKGVAATSARGSSATFLVCSSDPRRVATAERIAQAAAEYGIELVVEAVGERTFQNRLYQGDYELYLGEVRLSPTFDLTQFFNGGTLCYGGIGSDTLVESCREALKNSGNMRSLHSTIMSYGLICPILFKSYAVYATRGIIGNMYPALDNVFYTSDGRTLSDTLVIRTPDEVTEEDQEPEEG